MKVHKAEAVSQCFQKLLQIQDCCSEHLFHAVLMRKIKFPTGTKVYQNNSIAKLITNEKAQFSKELWWDPTLTKNMSFTCNCKKLVLGRDSYVQILVIIFIQREGEIVHLFQSATFLVYSIARGISTF